VTARRSLGDVDKAVRVTTPNYDYYYLCTELRRKRMIPVITKIRASSREEFGDLVRHAGEEFIYVLKGRIVVHTEFYDPVTLSERQSIYIDSGMGHAHLTAAGCHEAWRCSASCRAPTTISSAIVADTARGTKPKNFGGAKRHRGCHSAALRYRQGLRSAILLCR
jgi:hypothetical protein